MGSQIKSHISCISQVQEEEDEVDPLDKDPNRETHPFPTFP